MLTPSPQAQELMKALTGMEWPSINEDELREAADLYESTAEDFDTMRDELAELARYIRENFSGEAAQAFVRYAELLTGGEAPALAGVKDQAANLAQIADDTATDAEYVKWMILAQMIELIAEMIFEAAVWWVPGLGQAVTAHVSLLTMLVRLLVPRLIRALVRSIAVHTAVSVAMGLAMDALIQGVQMAMGNRDTWSTDSTMQALAYGAVQGLVGGAMSFAGAKAGARIGRMLGNDFTKLLTQETGRKLASLSGSARDGRRFADDLVGTLGGMNGELAKGLNKSANESLAKAFVRGVGDQFARSGLKGMTKEQARDVGTGWAKTVLREWTGPGSAATVGRALREELAGRVEGPALRVLADDLPDAMSKAGIGPSKGFLLGQYGTDMLLEGVSQNLSEGAYNVLTTGQFSTTGGTFLSGFLTTGMSHAGRHFVVQPLTHHLGQDHAWVQKLNDRLAALD
ncbi:WXG100-like domain-containing protein, partial [Streptomyces sp. NPDC002690]